MTVMSSIKGVLRTASAVMALTFVGLLAKCTSRKPADETISSTHEALKATAVLYDNYNEFFGSRANSQGDLETTSVIFPPNTPGCPAAGRVFVSHGSMALKQINLDQLAQSCAGIGAGHDSVGCTSYKTFSLAALLTSSGANPVVDASSFQNPSLATVPFPGNCGYSVSAPLTYVVGGTDTAIVRTGTSSLALAFGAERHMTTYSTTPHFPEADGCSTGCTKDADCAAVEAGPNTATCVGGHCVKPRCAIEHANNVTFVATSTDCGDSWVTHKTIDNGDGTGQRDTLRVSSTEGCGNLDQPRLEADPYMITNGQPRIYMQGGATGSCYCKNDRRRIYYSDNGGVSFTWAGNLPDQANFPMPAHGDSSPNPYPANMTTFSDGTLAMFGCASSGRPRVYWSLGGAYWQAYEDTTAAPCNNTNPASLPDNVSYNIGTMPSSMSRAVDNSMTSSYNFFRFAYQTRALAPQTGWDATLGYAFLPRGGGGPTPGAGLVVTGRIPLETVDSSIVHFEFIDPNPFPLNNPVGRPNTSLLYWQVGNSDASGHYKERYMTVSGLSNYSAAQDLSLSGVGSAARWNYTPSRAVGELDRGSYYFDSAASTAGTRVFDFLANWSQEHSGFANSAYVHYNKVQVTEPTFIAEQIDSTLTLSTDPGAARMGVRQGPSLIYAIAADSTGRVRRTALSDISQTWSAWGYLGNGTTNRAVAAVSWGTGRLDVVGVGINDKHMYLYTDQDFVSQQGGSGWAAIGGDPAGGFTEAPSIASPGTGKLFIVGVGTGGNIYYRTYGTVLGGGWNSAWYPLAGGVSHGAVSAVSLYPGRVDVFARGQNDQLWYYVAVDDGLDGWEGNGTWYFLPDGGTTGVVSGSPAAIVRDSSHFDFFAGDRVNAYIAGPNDTAGHAQIMHGSYENGPWSRLGTIGGILQTDANSNPNSSPYSTMAAVSVSTTKMRVFHRGLDNHLWWLKNN